MPTDLPENFSGTAPKETPGSALRALGHTLTHHIIAPLAYEYALCLAATVVVNGFLLHGRLNAVGAAFGVWSAGILARHFTRPKQPPQLVVNNDVTPADAAAFIEALNANVRNAKRPSPYL